MVNAISGFFLKTHSIKSSILLNNPLYVKVNSYVHLFYILADDYRITACFGFIKHFAAKYKYLTEKNPTELQQMHAAGLLTAESDNTRYETSAQRRDNLDYIVPTGISMQKIISFFNASISNAVHMSLVVRQDP